MKSNRRKRLVRLLLTLLIAVLAVQFILIPIGFGVAATRAPRQQAGDAPDGFGDVTLTTESGDSLAAWYAEPQNGAVVLVLHGAGGSRRSIEPYARMLQDHGFGVLAFDARGHGESSGQTNLLGWQGTEDVGAAMAFLEGRDGVEAVGALGLSMGGETVLGAASTFQKLAAIVSDGATQRCVAEFHAVESHRNPISSAMPVVVEATVRVITQQSPPPPMIESVQAAGSTQFLLIAAENAPDEQEFNTLFAEAAGGRSELWVVPNGGHTNGYALYPDEYERRVVAFLTAALVKN